MTKKNNKNKKEQEEIDALEAMTKEILKKVSVKHMQKPQLVQIIIYESSV